MSEPNLKGSFIRNVSFGALSRIVQTLVGFFIITYVMKTVGIKDWGILTISVSLVTMLSVLQISLSGGTGKRLTDLHISKNTREYVQYYSGTLLITGLLIFIIIFLAVFYDLFFLNHLMEEEPDKLKTIFYLTVFNSVITVGTLPGVAVLQSVNRVDTIAIITTIGLILRSILVATLFFIKKDIVTYSCILLIEAFFNFVITYFIIRVRARSFLKFSFQGLDRGYLLHIFKFNMYNFINSLNYLFFIQLPAIVVAKKYGLVYSGYYGIGIQLNGLFRGLLNIIMNALSPLFNILNAQNRRQKLTVYYLISTKIFVFIAVLLVVFVVFFINDFLFLWLGSTDRSLIQFLRIFLIFTAVGIAFIPSALMIITLEKLRTTSISGLLISFTVSLVIYFLPLNLNEYVFVPIVLTVFFFIYNLQRAILSYIVLNIKINELLRVLLFSIFSIVVMYVIWHLNFDGMIIRGLLSFLLVIVSVFFLFTKNDFKIVVSLIKK